MFLNVNNYAIFDKIYILFECPSLNTAKGESAPSSPVECYTSESSLYSDSDGENAGSLKKESKLLSRGSVQGASASEELLECNMTNTEKQRVSLDETLESMKDGLNHSEASQKDLSGDKVVHCNNTEEMSTKRDDNTGVPIPDISVITDSKEGSKGNVEESKEQDVETTTKGGMKKNAYSRIGGEGRASLEVKVEVNCLW